MLSFLHQGNLKLGFERSMLELHVLLIICPRGFMQKKKKIIMRPFLDY